MPCSEIVYRGNGRVRTVTIYIWARGEEQTSFYFILFFFSSTESRLNTSLQAILKFTFFFSSDKFSLRNRIKNTFWSVHLFWSSRTTRSGSSECRRNRETNAQLRSIVFRFRAFRPIPGFSAKKISLFCCTFFDLPDVPARSGRVSSRTLSHISYLKRINSIKITKTYKKKTKTVLSQNQMRDFFSFGRLFSSAF